MAFQKISVSFDEDTLRKLHEMAEQDQRNISNLLQVLVKEEHKRRQHPVIERDVNGWAPEQFRA